MITNVIDYLKYSAAQYPDKIAFRDEEHSITFAQLERQSRILACKIVEALNGKTKKAIGIYLPKSVQCIISLFAVAYSGNCYTPLDITMPMDRIKKISKTLIPELVITENTLIGAVGEFSKQFIAIDSVNYNNADVSDSLVKKIQSKIIDVDPLYIMFTSGSTGVPKGVVVSHRSVIDYIEWLTKTFSFSNETVFGNQAPFYFDNSILDIYCTVKNGCETVIIPEEYFLSSKRLCRYLDEQEINTIFWVPSALILVANSGALNTDCPTKLEKILFCGEVMPNKQLNSWRKVLPKVIYANLYGPTEITDVCTYYIIDREFRDDESLPIGFPCRNIEVLVLDAEDQSISVGKVGELCIRGTCLAHGYYGNEEKTDSAFTQNPLNDKYPDKIYRTGDMVRYNEFGELIYVGRKDFQIKHMGHRIELGEIEMAASAFQGVERCCALYDNETKEIVLVVVPEQIEKISLYQHLKTMIPRYMLPERIAVVRSIPLNQNGKIDRLKSLDLFKKKEK